jgi:hypothetical protein
MPRVKHNLVRTVVAVEAEDGVIYLYGWSYSVSYQSEHTPARHGQWTEVEWFRPPGRGFRYPEPHDFGAPPQVEARRALEGER